MTMTRRDALSSMFAAAATAGCAAGLAGQEPAAHTLDHIAARKGMRFGSAVGMRKRDSEQAHGFDSTAYRALIARECSVVVPENELKWRALRPTPNEFRFEQADALLAWAKRENLAVRGHTLLWHSPKWLPDWLTGHDFGTQPVPAAERLLREHVSTVCRRYSRAIHSWDVVNESVDPATGRLHNNAFTPHLGNLGQIELAFRVAHEQAPHAQLVYNDFMKWGDYGAKHRAGVLELLQTLRSRGVPVHALGLQSHLGTGENGVPVKRGGAHERDWRRFLDDVTAIGLDLLITEFDVNDQHLPADTERRDAEIAAMARDYLDVTLSYPRLHTFLAWGLADPYSWMQTWWPRADGLAKRSCPYDAQLQPKPLRAAMALAFAGMPPRATPTHPAA